MRHTRHIDSRRETVREAREYSGKIAIAANQYLKEKEYWLKQLAGDLVKTAFPYTYKRGGVDGAADFGVEHFEFPPPLAAGPMKLRNDSDIRLHMILVTGLIVLLHKYSTARDILVGIPVVRQAHGEALINTMLPIRNRLDGHMTLKELILQVGSTIVEAVEHQNYPVELLREKLQVRDNDNGSGSGCPLFATVILLTNIHDRDYIGSGRPDMLFSFHRQKEALLLSVEYRASLYDRQDVTAIVGHLESLMPQMPSLLDHCLADIDLLTVEDKQRILHRFNNPPQADPPRATIAELLARQVEKSPHRLALVYDNISVTYRELARLTDQGALLLRAGGAGPGQIVALMTDPSIEMVVGILGILKAGAAYLPLDPDIPGPRLTTVLEDSRAAMLLVKANIPGKYPFTLLQGSPPAPFDVTVTPRRPQIKDLDRLLLPDRSLIDYRKYSGEIGMAMARHTITMQATRGCPYQCAFCHKISPAAHVARSAEHLFSEVRLYYNMGIRRFVIIDDIFNLDARNSRRFFRLLIDNKLQVQIYFPNGLRGDILTPDYIDLMAQAGVIDFALSLETASPRLQRLIGKNLNIKKLRKNIDYICENHRPIILELNTIHGFPTETEAEALMTLAFIRSIEWLHFPYVHILKIYPHTKMARIALENNIPAEAIAASQDLAFHELPTTLPFDRTFTLQYQTRCLDYILSKERLRQVLPYQMKALTEDEMVQKYDSFLPTKIAAFGDFLRLAGFDGDEWAGGQFMDPQAMAVPDLTSQMKRHFAAVPPKPGALKILLLDLSRFFSRQRQMLYDVSEPPLGLMCLLTHLQQQYGGRIEGRIAKSGVDFDSYGELHSLLRQFKPDVIGLRTLTFYRNFFHQTVALIRQWGIDVPVVSGGPYATTDFREILQAGGVDLVVLGEGEITFAEVIGKILEHGGKLPGPDTLSEIAGIAFVPPSVASGQVFGRQVVVLDEWAKRPAAAREHPKNRNKPTDLAYILYTSGSTGPPRAAMVEHAGVVNLVREIGRRIYRRHGTGLNIGLVSPYFFDASIKQIFPCLLQGHTLFVVDEHTRLAGKALLAYYRQRAIDVADGTPILVKILLDAVDTREKGAVVRHLLIGGEELTKSLLAALAAKFARLPVITNVYGPTEGCDVAALFEVNGQDIEILRTVPIGSPITNVRLYVVNEKGELLPPGLPGELCLGGVSLARGYLNDPGRSAEKFGEDPFSPGQRLYKTGDLARWLPDGNLVFLGRMDRQVKIRGFRLEPAEIEHHLSAVDYIAEAVVVERAEADDQYLCAYIVAREEVVFSRLRDSLAARLPAYMIPTYFVQMAALPLTANGKIDRKALPPPVVKVAQEYVPPANYTEERLLTIWSEVLAIDKEMISVEADFFELGGHSLKAINVIALMHKALRVRVQLAEFFGRPNIRSLAAYIGEAAKDRSFVSIQRVEEREYYPLSSAQKRLFFLQQLDVNNTSYNIPLVATTGDRIDRERIEGALQRLIHRHESLRTSFAEVDGMPVQRIHPHVSFKLDCYEAGQAEAKQLVENYVRPFDLGQAPLLRSAVIRVTGGGFIWIADMHHIISDGTSSTIIIEDFISLYNGKEPQPLKLQYRDFARWQNDLFESGKIKSQEEYWLGLYSTGIPPLKLPTDYPRPTSLSLKGDACRFGLTGDEAARFQEMAAASQATLFMKLLAVFNVLLYKYSGQQDIVVVTGVSGRNNADLQKLVGFFLNILAMRNYPAREKSFEEFLMEVKENSMKAFENQDYQFEKLVGRLKPGRASSYYPFNVGLEFSNYDRSKYIGQSYGAAGQSPFIDLKNEYVASNHDLTLFAREIDGELDFSLEYSTDLFRRETIELYAGHLIKIIKVVTGNVNIKIGDIQLLDDDNLERLAVAIKKDAEKMVTEFDV
jgi:amino acid adenylation domain-containing protein